jgi:type I restriction enzyme S subunit
MTELPKGWSSAQLNEFCHIEMGQAPPSTSYNTEGIGLPLYQGKAEFGILFPTPRKYCSEPTKVGSEGSVLLSVRAPVGPTNIAPHQCAIGRGLAAVSPLGGIPNRFVLWGLREKEDELAKGATGSTFAAISKSDVVSILFKLPPLNEQRRIVEKIEAMFDEIDKGIESLHTARTALGLYRQSLLKSAFEGRLTADWRAQNTDKLEAPETLLARIQKARNARYKAALDDWQQALAQWRADGEKGKKPAKPKRFTDIKPQHIPKSICPNFANSWGAIRFGNLNLTVSDGPFGSNLKTSDYTETGIRVIRLENIGYGEFIEEKRSFISEDKYETIKKHSVYPGTIMVSSFVTDAVRSCMLPKSIPIAINKADCFAAVLAGEQVVTKFAAYYLQSPQVFDQVEDLVHGVGRPRINTTQLKELHFPVCSLDEQVEIVGRLDARLEAADKLEAEIDAALTRANALRQSILKKAFSGKLVPQDPADEPASALLARIKAERDKAPKTRRRRVEA